MKINHVAIYVKDLEKTREFYEKYGYVLDTHTAVAYAVYEKYKAATGDKNKTVLVSTASPYKFADSVATAIGIQPSENGFENIKLTEPMSALLDSFLPHR